LAAALDRDNQLLNLRLAAEMIADINNILVDLACLNISTRDVTHGSQMIAAASVEMAASVQQISRNSEGAASDAGTADKTVSSGRGAVNKVAGAMTNIVRVVDETAGKRGRASAPGQIGQILGVIEGSPIICCPTPP
jgi:methyl-accepting chemotaxis protein